MSDSSPATYRDPFAPGEDSRRRKGRAKGSRAKLAQRFFEDTYAAWEEQGPSVLARAAFHDPVAFANMVARLMPQKIEVSTPTDGMSDERLAELLDFAERMAGLKAEQAKVLQSEVIEAAALPSHAHKLADENGDLANSAEAGGGGPLCEMGGGGENTPSTLRADPAKASDTTSNALNVLPERADPAKDPHRPFRALNEPSSSDLATPSSPLPYPVGKPFATPGHVTEKQNRYGLSRDEDIDPASLF